MCAASLGAAASAGAARQDGTVGAGQEFIDLRSSVRASTGQAITVPAPTDQAIIVQAPTDPAATVPVPTGRATVPAAAATAVAVRAE